MADLTPKGYCAVTDIEEYLLTEVLGSFEPKVSNWIRETEAYIERITGRVFIAESSASERWFDSDGLSEQKIDECVEITEVLVYDQYEELLFTLTNADDYIIYPYNETPIRKLIKKVKSNKYFYQGTRNLKVTAKWGYSTEVPDLIRFATTVIAAGVVNFSNNSDGEIASERIGEYSVTYKNEAQWADFERAKDIINSYRKPNV